VGYLLKFYKRRKIRKVLRGAINIKREFFIFYPLKLINELIKIDFGNSLDILKKRTEYFDELKICLMQKFINNNNNFYKNLFLSHGNFNNKLKLPLPNIWFKELNKKGYKINYFISRILFLNFCLKSILRSQLFVLKNLFFNNFPSIKAASIFLSIDAEDLNKNNENIIKQLIDHKIILHNEKIIINSRKIYFKQQDISNKYILSHSLFPKLLFFKQINFFLFNIKTIIYFILCIIFNKLEEVLAFEELIYLKYYSLISKNDKTNIKYFFNNSNAHYKPLWTYKHEKKFENIFMYFYSANIENIQFSQKNYLDVHPSYNLLTWQKYIVWDEYQKNFIQHNSKRDSVFHILGSVDFFSRTDFTYKKNPDIYNIILFDVYPMRPTLYTTHGFCEPCYTSKKVFLEFYNDIYQSLKEYKNIKIYRKGKRKIKNNFLNNSFIYNFNNKYKNSIIKIDESISCKSIIKNFDIVICMPFTSPALIAKLLNKPVIYYDPTNSIKQNEYHGIKLLKNKNDLHNWLDKYLK
jgi:polysaccharide biosynthesis PFTS motif protein